MSPNDETLEALKRFIQSPASQHALQKLSKRAKIGITVATRSYTYSNNEITTREEGDVDLELLTTPFALRHITQLENNSPDKISRIGIEIVKSIAHTDPEWKSHLKIHASLFTLIKNGYFSVASTGGKDFFRFLASKGLGNMRKIQEKVRRLMK